ncbi:hypothetical protein niasHS_002158 [Heterodera schachtii]|uniref:PH domain-containing protein n=1 Tax=Heterodera schachtii TaxID=97005 RepID=A0ABD2KMG4_HETSC
MGRHSVDFLQLCIKRQKREDTAQMERTTTPQHPQQPQRAIVHRGWLQQKMFKNGTLLRKKQKVFYENELFVVLSVHNVSNGCIPRLEWFAEQSAIFERRPLKCQDLTDCQYVNVSVGDERCLAIGFVDGSAPVLELLAPSVEERAQWVDILRMTLRRLNFLNTESSDNEQQRERTDNGPSQWPRAANEYVVLAGTANNDANPSTSSPPPQQTLPRANGRREVTQSPRVPMPQIPSTHLRTLLRETAQSGERSQTQLRTEKSLDDSLPPMRQHSAQKTHLNGEREGTRKTDGMTSGVKSEEHCPSPSSPENGDAFDPSHSLAPPPLPPRTPRRNAAQCSTESDAFPRTVPPLPKSPIPLSPSLNLSHYEVLTTPSSPPPRPQYDRLSAGNRHSHLSLPLLLLIAPTLSAHYDVLCAPSTQYDVLNVPSSSALFLQQYNDNNGSATAPTERIFRDALNRSRRLFFSFTLLTEHIAFVELFDKVWVAGWTSAVDLRLRENGCSLNFGDEVEQIDGSEVRNLQALTEIYQRIMPGAQIPLLLRANPTMMVFTLVKPENPRLNLGIKFNRPAKFLLRHPFDCLTIDSIALKSPAQKVNLPATVPAYLHQPAAHSVKSPQPKPFHVSSPSSPNLLPSGGTDRAVITHLDGVPLNPFGPKDQFFLRLDSVLVGHSFNVTLHSADFCSRLARQMKNQLGNKWRHFVHGE